MPGSSGSDVASKSVFQDSAIAFTSAIVGRVVERRCRASISAALASAGSSMPSAFWRDDVGRHAGEHAGVG